jgi:hypothetical protein
MGYRIYCIPHSVVYHEYELKMPPQKMFWLEYGRLSALLCYLNALTFIALLPAFLFTEVLVTGYCLTRGPKMIGGKIRAWNAVFSNRRGIMKRRQKAQSLRKLSDFQLLRRFGFKYQWSQVLHILK